MIKNNQGITLLSLTIMIIILIILASVSIYSGAGTIKYVKFTNAKHQMEVMQTEVNSLYEKYKAGDDTFLEYGVETSDTSCEQEILSLTFSKAGVTAIEDMNKYRFYSESYIKDILNLQGIDYDFLVNVQERKIILFGGILYEDVEYYTAEDFGILNVVESTLNE